MPSGNEREVISRESATEIIPPYTKFQYESLGVWCKAKIQVNFYNEKFELRIPKAYFS